MKLLTALATLALVAAPVQAQANTQWGNYAGRQACASIRRGATSAAAFEGAMDNMLANPTLKAEFIQFAASKGSLAQMNAEGELYRGFYAACPEHNPVNLLN